MKHIKVNTIEEAWEKIDEIFPTDYTKDESSSKNAGYPVFRSTADEHYYYYICDLGERFEINLGIEEEVTVWVAPEIAKDCGTCVTEKTYEKLAKSGREMSEAEARIFIEEEFGFAASKVQIVNKVNTYYVTKDHRLHKMDEYIRKPIYESSDWNYVRFNCCGWQYECTDGVLRFYNS